MKVQWAMTLAGARRIRWLSLINLAVIGVSKLVGICIASGPVAFGHALMAIANIGFCIYIVMGNKVRAAEQMVVEVMLAATKVVTAEKMKRVHPLARKDPKLEQARNN